MAAKDSFHSASKVALPGSSVATANSSNQQIQASLTSSSSQPSSLPFVVASSASERSKSHSSRRPASARPTYIIKPTIIGLPVAREPSTPAITLLSTSISVLMYLCVMIIIFTVNCPPTREVVYFFTSVLLAFTGSLFTLIVDLTAVRYHTYNCVSTSLSLLYSGSAALVLNGLINSSIYGLCKPPGAPDESLFKSGQSSNYFIFGLTSLSVMWQLVAFYFYD